MAVKVRIPSPLRRLTGNLALVEVEARDVAGCLEEMERRYPGVKERLLDSQGDIQQFVNIYVNGEDVRFLQELGTPLKAGDELSIVPAIAGGSPPRATRGAGRLAGKE